MYNLCSSLTSELMFNVNKMVTDNGVQVFFISITLISIPSLKSREKLSIS